MEGSKKWPLTKDELENLYISKNLNISEICILCDQTFDTVRYYLRKFKIVKSKEARDKKQKEAWNSKSVDELSNILQKRKETCIGKYGVENPMQNDEVKQKLTSTCMEKYGVACSLAAEEIREKIKNTCLQKYGVDSFLKSNEIREKIRETNLDKYGYENPMQNDAIKNKVFETNLERYGVKSAIQSKEIQERSKKTCVNKYGVEFPGITKEAIEKRNETCKNKYGSESPMCSDTVKEKLVNTNLDKYGCRNPMQNETVREKAKSTLLKRYGVDNCSKCPEIREKAKATNLIKYGCENPMQNAIVLNKMLKSLENNGNVPTSSQQMCLFETVKNKYGDEKVKLNYVIGEVSLDIRLSVGNALIAIEYDGWYWHKDKKEKDRKRDYFLYSNGYKVLRIRSAYALPTEEELFGAIDYLITTNHHHKIITLPDWDEQEQKYQNKLKEKSSDAH